MEDAAAREPWQRGAPQAGVAHAVLGRFAWLSKRLRQDYLTGDEQDAIERERWALGVWLGVAAHFLRPGDLVAAAGVEAPHMVPQTQELVNQWMAALQDVGMPYSPDCELREVCEGFLDVERVFRVLVHNQVTTLVTRDDAGVAETFSLQSVMHTNPVEDRFVYCGLMERWDELAGKMESCGHVVIKVLNKSRKGLDGPEQRYWLVQQLRNEFVMGRLLSMFEHPNINSFTHYFETEREIYAVFPIHDMSLTAFCSQVVEGRLTLLSHELRSVCLQMARAVHFMLSVGVAHRDIKPDNFVISSTQQGLLVQMIDFGLAASLRRGAEPYYYAPIHGQAGTTPWMAPEVFSYSPTKIGPDYGPRGAYDPIRSETWSLGVCFFALALVNSAGGKLPFIASPFKMPSFPLDGAFTVVHTKGARALLRIYQAKAAASGATGELDPVVESLVDRMVAARPDVRMALGAVCCELERNP